MPSYLDCNATTPAEDRVVEAVLNYTREEFGNSGSRTHEYGNRAKRAVENARDQIRKVVQVEREELILTSGATESNNLAILGLAQYGEKIGKKHIVTTAIEHKAVLEPVQFLAKDGFEVSVVSVDRSGRVSADDIAAAIRNDTLLVSVMHANNETGVIQPIEQIAEFLPDDGIFLHVDAAQTYGKLIEPLRHDRIDMISVSSHKVYGPKGIGALVTRRRGIRKIPLSPLLYGGGQERGLRPGTMPVPLAVGFGVAAEMALRDAQRRATICERIRSDALASLAPLGPVQNGDPERTMPHVPP